MALVAMTTNAEIVEKIAELGTALGAMKVMMDDREKVALMQRARMEADIAMAAAAGATSAATSAETARKIEGMLKAWENANFLLSVVKWLGGIVTVLSGLWFIITHFGASK